MSDSQTTVSDLERMEQRVAELELKLLGAGAASSPPPSSSADDLSKRLDKLMRSATPAAAPSVGGTRGGVIGGSSPADEKARADAKRSALHEEFRAIDRLMSDLALDPLAGPTALASTAGGGGSSAAATAPTAYRRMEVLASADSMRRDMDLLARIRDLTSIGTKAGGGGRGSDGGSASLSSSRVVNCPIVASERYDLPSDPEAAERLERLCFRAARLTVRAADASRRADEMLGAYGRIMASLSEKMVLAEEQLTSPER